MKRVPLFLGMLLAFFALYVMLMYFYEGMVDLMVALMIGGDYHPFYLRGEKLLVWLALVFASSGCFAYATAEDWL